MSPVIMNTTTGPNPHACHGHSSKDEKPAFILNRTEIELLLVAGAGFFLDAYDLFVINPVATMLQYRLFDGHPLPANLEGFLKAAANIGTVIGQLAFGFAGDFFGRKALYGKELMLIIFATILAMTTPTGSLSPNGSLIYLAIFRILVGVGIGADYPISASVITDRSSLRKRGTMLAYLISNQGWGSFAGGLVTVIVLACYRHTMESEGEISKVDGAWRIVVGFSLVPAFGTLYHRLTLPESTRFVDSQKLKSGDIAEIRQVIADFQRLQEHEDANWDKTSVSDFLEDDIRKHAYSEKQRAEVEDTMNAIHSVGFVKYFSQWKNAKLLIATSACWFFLDIAFYGINLNQNVVLQEIGYDGSEGTPWGRLFKISTGNIIVTALGLIPGYYATIITVEKLGRKWIQIQGFILAALFLGILAGMFHTLSKPAFIVNFALLQFFFNFGANMTIYVIPAEVFPTQYRATAHGISAAAGKAGAIISALVFNSLSKDIGTPAILWIFFGCCIAGAGFTLLLPEVKGRDPDLLLIQEMGGKI